ncbi:GNAT family N-acetyltransferase [Bacillus sp. AGMB 02131]|uniref:GNAT family N-acetyltransferase n=1 Tax=Peribacillus faecalis TaxID=2772559 RepID=A0A927CUH4_9BACI|nr:GNAT family N-acetyltransferase [Peribacillus faecalis]MBD3106947.1 GNAT family N-acetyltransferase [Peribacillus faecalis]
MITLEPMTAETLYIAKEIINSNKAYNTMENGHDTRSEEEIAKQLLQDQCESYFLKADDTYIGIVDLMINNPKDDTPWIGLFMIHHDYQGYGYGSIAYDNIEQHLKEDRGLTKLRLAVIPENEGAKNFWESFGYCFYKTGVSNNRTVACYEKTL